MRLLLAANNQATRRNEIIKSYLQLGSSSNRYAPGLPQQETKSSTKQLAPTDPILGPENLLKTGFAQKGLPSRAIQGHPLVVSMPITGIGIVHVSRVVRALFAAGSLLFRGIALDGAEHSL